MRRVCLVTMVGVLASHQVLAQPATSAKAVPPAQRSSQRPVDHGPFTPEANGAYQGGGMVLRDAPGAPPPTPQPTPRGQMPANLVAPR